MIRPVDPKLAAPLFVDWPETLVWSCISGCMGSVAAADGAPACAKALLGDFSFLAGDPADPSAADLIRYGAGRHFQILTPKTQDWFPLIQQVGGDSVQAVTRYAICKDTVFDRERLMQYIAALPQDYSLHELNEFDYASLSLEGWSCDFCSQYASWQDYQAHGLGVLAVHEGAVVAGASSYSWYPGGIEIEVDTLQAHRRKGLALACASALILRCLSRGLYPSWDAANLASVALAEKLGYRLKGPYTVYYYRTETPMP